MSCGARIVPEALVPDRLQPIERIRLPAQRLSYRSAAMICARNGLLHLPLPDRAARSAARRSGHFAKPQRKTREIVNFMNFDPVGPA